MAPHVEIPKKNLAADEQEGFAPAFVYKMQERGEWRKSNKYKN